MSKTWYPVIDYDKCTGCLTCVNKCKHGVYALAEGKPVVVKPVACIHGCHGCGNICPENAIEYVGGDGKADGNDDCCSGGDKKASGGGCCSGEDKSCCGDGGGKGKGCCDG